MTADMQGGTITGTIAVTGTINGTIAIGGGGSAKLETLNVSVNPAQAQTLTPGEGEGVDGWNEVKIPQAMECRLNSGFVLAMGGSAYDDIVSREYITVYDASGKKSTRFKKQSIS